MWIEDKCELYRFIPCQLTVNVDNQTQPLSFLPQHKKRILVGSDINPSNSNVDVEESFNSSYNALGHFEAFERDLVRVVFFSPNCTSWKQLCNMGIIAALKKRYKFLHLRDVLEFYDLDESTKARKTECIGRLRRGAVGVDFSRLAHLLDCASCVLEA